MFNVKVYVTLKEAVVDPQGNVAKNSLQTLGYDEVDDVRIGKYVELTLKDGENVEARVKEMCEKLLVNPVIEDYTFEIEEVAAK